MAKKPYRKLHPSLKKHYDGFKFDRKLASSNNKRHHLFNVKLRNYLLSCQDNEFFPSKEFVEKKCHDIQDEVDFELTLNGADKDRKSPERTDMSIGAMEFLPIITNQDQNNDHHGGLYLKVLGLIPLQGLTEHERKWVEDTFSIEGEIESDTCKVNLLSTPVSAHINDEKQFKINDYLKRVARQKFKEKMNEEGLDTPFKYGLIDKVRDFWLDGGI